MRNYRLAAALGGLLLAGCASMHGSTYSSVDIYGKGRVYVGMTGPEVTALLGTPQSIGSGTFSPMAAKYFFGVQPGPRTVEWAWTLNNGDIMVAWLESGQVALTGLVPAAKLNPQKEAPETTK